MEKNQKVLDNSWHWELTLNIRMSIIFIDFILISWLESWLKTIRRFHFDFFEIDLYCTVQKRYSCLIFLKSNITKFIRRYSVFIDRYGAIFPEWLTLYNNVLCIKQQHLFIIPIQYAYNNSKQIFTWQKLFQLLQWDRFP